MSDGRLGIKIGSGGSIIGTARGVAKARNAREVRRKPEEGGRCSDGGIDGFSGVPWEPYPGSGGGLEIKSKVRLPAGNERTTINMEGNDEHVPRRMKTA